MQFEHVIEWLLSMCCLVKALLYASGINGKSHCSKCYFWLIKIEVFRKIGNINLPFSTFRGLAREQFMPAANVSWRFPWEDGLTYTRPWLILTFHSRTTCSFDQVWCETRQHVVYTFYTILYMFYLVLQNLPSHNPVSWDTTISSCDHPTHHLVFPSSPPAAHSPSELR